MFHCVVWYGDDCDVAMIFEVFILFIEDFAIDCGVIELEIARDNL
jgi:hypothetical protein